MNKTIATFLSHLWKSILFWTLAMVLWGMFRFYGLDSQPGITINEDFHGNLQLMGILQLFALASFLMGILYATKEFAF